MPKPKNQTSAAWKKTASGLSQQRSAVLSALESLEPFSGASLVAAEHSKFAVRHQPRHAMSRFPALVEIDNCCQLLHLEAMPTQNVNLPPHFKKFVETNVLDGRFGNASEVVRAGLRLLEHEQTLRQLKIQRLRESAKTGIDDVAAGRFTDLPAADISRHLEKIARSALRKAPAGQ